MLRIVMFAIALLVIPATASKVDASCSQVFEVAAARVRWAAVRQSSVDPAHYEESCRAYGDPFFKAVEARQATSICEDGIDRQRASRDTRCRDRRLQQPDRITVQRLVTCS